MLMDEREIQAEGETSNTEDTQTKIAYQCYATGEYAWPINVVGDRLPMGASWTPPPADITEGYVAVLVGSEWELKEDHRGETGYVKGQKIVITDIGPLPEGFTTLSPQEDYERKKEKIRELKELLNLNDLRSVRPLRAIFTGKATDTDNLKIRVLEDTAMQIRKELSSLVYELEAEPLDESKDEG